MFYSIYTIFSGFGSSKENNVSCEKVRKLKNLDFV
jgi:hypothetical protein